MFFESFLLNFSVLGVLIIALTFDYVTKYFSYWYVRHVPYKACFPFFGSDYHRVLGLRNTSQEVRKLCLKHKDEPLVGCVRSRIPDLIIKNSDAANSVLVDYFENFQNRGLCLNKTKDVCLRNNIFYAEGEKWALLRKKLESLLNNVEFNFEDRNCYLSGTNGESKVQQFLANVLDEVFQDLLISGNDNSNGFLVRNITKSLRSRSIMNKFKSYMRNIFPSLYKLFDMSTITEQNTTFMNKLLEKSQIVREIANLKNEELDVSKKKTKESENDFVYSIICSVLHEGYLPCLTVLSAILFELARRPKIQEYVRLSLSKDTKSDDYLDQFIDEILRIYSPYSVLTRQCTKTFKFPDKNILIDKDMTITISVDNLHKDCKNFKNEATFDPENFSKDEKLKMKPCVFLPFGAGPRKCIGENLARNMIKGITSQILKKYKIDTCSLTPSELHLSDHNFMRVVDNEFYLNFVAFKN